MSKWRTPPLSVQEGELDEGFALSDCCCPACLPRAEDRTQHIWDGFGGLTRWWWLQWRQLQWLVTTMTILIGSTQAFKGSTISLDHPWLIDLSHLLLVVSASSNVVVYAVQVLSAASSHFDKERFPRIQDFEIFSSPTSRRLLWSTEEKLRPGFYNQLFEI